MKDPNSDQQRKMNEVLMGGRGKQKRLYSVDKTLYGTEEGAKLALEAQEKAKMKAEKKRKKKKKEREASDEGSVDGESTLTGGRILKSSVAAVAIAGALAAGASFLLGSRRSQSK